MEIILGSPRDELNVDLYEFNTHSFIVKIWLEETAEADGRVTWRGHITHIPGGERRYVHNLSEITMFIRTYLAQMDVKFGLYWRVRQWLKQRKLFLKKRT